MGCVYAIVNSLNGDKYVGSTVRDVGLRWANHLKELKRGTHHSCHLQRAWKKYGGGVFQLQVLCVVSDNKDLLKMEQVYLDQGKAAKGKGFYNVCWVAGNCVGRKYSKATLRRLSESHMGKGRTQKSVRKQVRTWLRRHSKKYIFRSPEGRRHTTNNLRGFGRIHGLNPGCLRLLWAKKIWYYRGWTRFDIDLPVFAFVSPEGEKHRKIKNLKVFCSEQSLNYRKMSALHCGRSQTHKGWRKLKEA